MNPKNPSTSPFNSIFTFLTVPKSRSEGMWDNALSWALSALLLAVAILPDERLVRTKLMTLELGIYAASFLFILRALWRGHLKLSNVPLLAAVLGWLVFIFARVLASDNMALGVAEVRRALLCLGAFWTADQALGLDGGRRRILAGWGIGAGVIALYGLLQYTGGIGPVAVPQMARVMGTFGNPIFFGAYLAISLPLLWGLWLSAESGGEKTLWAGASIAGLIAIYLTHSRAAWIGFTAALLAGLLILYGRRKSLWIALGALLVVVGVFVWKTQDTWTRDQAHLKIWRDTVKLWKTAPLAGVGPGEFHVHFPDVAGEDLKSKWPEGKFIVNYAHNEYLQILSETGLAGLALWLLMAGIFFWGQVIAMLPVGPQSRAKTGGIPKRMFTNQNRFSVNFPDLDPERTAVFCALSAVFAQSFFSVDLRFAVSSGLLFFLMGSVSASRALDLYWRLARTWLLGGTALLIALFGIVTVEKTPDAWALNLLGAFQWTAHDGWRRFPDSLRSGLLTRLLQPYVAQRESAQSVSFFDRRLLDPARTIQDLEALAKQYPYEPVVWEKLAYVYAKEIKAVDAQGQSVLRQDMAEKSIAAYGRVTGLFPARPGPFNNLGNIYFTLGDRAKAMEYWQKAVDVDPAQLDARLNLGKVYYLEGKLKAAADEFKKVLELDPANPEASVYLRKMVE